MSAFRAVVFRFREGDQGSTGEARAVLDSWSGEVEMLVSCEEAREEGADYISPVALGTEAVKDSKQIEQDLLGAHDRPRSRWHVDAFEIGVLVISFALSLWIVAVLLHRKSSLEVWTGTNGLFIGDQMQYLGWIRDSAQHVLIGNPFDSTGGTHDYLNPALAISAALTHLGVGAWLSFLLWVPVAVIVLFVATRALVHRLVVGKAKRRAALILALFFLSPADWLGNLLHWHQLWLTALGLEIWPGMYLWGYPLTAISVACMIGVLLSYERDRKDQRVRISTPALALFCGWLQPWQGAVVLVVLMGSEAWLGLRTRRTASALLAWTLAAAALPLVYYSLLSHLDATWALFGQVNGNNRPGVPLADLVLTVVPLAACAILAYRRFPLTFADLAVRVWPLAAFAVLYFIQLTHIGTFPEHSLQGLSVPLAVLAVLGTDRVHLGGPVLRLMVGVVLVAALVGPSFVWELDQASSVGVPYGAEPFLINRSEQDALNYLDRDPTTGAVLATLYLGQIVPAETGRKTWLAMASYTPNFEVRTIEANELFSGLLSPSSSIDLVRASRTRFLLADCQHEVDLTARLGPILQTERHFGCATVYEVRFRR